MTPRAPFLAAAVAVALVGVVGCSAAEDRSAGIPSASGPAPATSGSAVPGTTTTGVPAPELSPEPSAPTERSAGATSGHPTAPVDPGSEGGPAGAVAPVPAAPIPELPPVPVGETVAVGGGLSAEVVDLRPARIEGGLPGDVAGPAVAVTVEVTNAGSAPADIAFVTVSAAYGDGQEAPGYDGEPADPLVGPIPAGGSREGTYVFGVPGDGAGTLVVRVSADPERPLAVFTADASVRGDR